MEGGLQSSDASFLKIAPSPLYKRRAQAIGVKIRLVLLVWSALCYCETFKVPLF